MQFNGIYKNKKILITGCTGFKGTWLSLWLKILGANVVGISFDDKKFKSHLKETFVNFKNYKCDIRNQNKLSNLILKIQPEIIFHLAAQPLVINSYLNPIMTWETNVVGTANLLNSCISIKKLKAIVIVTSDKVYNNSKIKKYYKENDTLGGRDPYSSSKASVELLVNSFRSSFFNKKKSPLIATTRAGNVIGGGDWGAHRIIPDIVTANYTNKKLVIRNPDSVRPWQHVLDCLSGYLFVGQKLISQKKEYSRSWNFGPNSQSSKKVIDVIKAFNASEGFDLDWVIKKDITKKETNILLLSNSLAKRKLKWRPVLNFNESIELTTEWYSKFYTNKSLIYEKQFETYFKKSKIRKVNWIK